MHFLEPGVCDWETPSEQVLSVMTEIISSLEWMWSCIYEVKSKDLWRWCNQVAQMLYKQT